MSDILIFVGSVLANRAPEEAASGICKPSLARATHCCQRLVSFAFLQHERHGTLVIHCLRWVRCHELVGYVGGELLSMMDYVPQLTDLLQIVFAGPPLLSKTTGADKRTSAFIFGNKSAASVQKKESRRRNK